MKRRRPEKFSDSVRIKTGKLNRSLLEYHLETLTSRNQERDFETFCVKLAQLEICPNLRVQTGPVGGGDSKADSENIPVAPLVSINYWTGLANRDNERWAIAISAKKDWVAKVKNDVDGIVKTSRGYKHIFFITSQFARDKKRAEVEDELTQQHRIQVTVLDRNWILDKVFSNDRQKLAIETLAIGQGLEEEIQVGPRDTERIQKLKEINLWIEEAVSNSHITLEVINKSLDVALLAREIDRPRAEVDGLFDRAIRFAESWGNEELLFNAKYQLAWTTYFWFEDFTSFLEQYDQNESLALNTTNIFTVERLNNLYQILTVVRGFGYIDDAFLSAKWANLRTLLLKFIGFETRPSASLQARTILVINELSAAIKEAADAEPALNTLRDIVIQCEGMVGFPFDNIVEFAEIYGAILNDHPAYEQLFEKMVEVSEKRKGAISSSELLQQNGYNHLKSGRIYKAIDFLGRSLTGLAKEESKDSFIYSLYLIGLAYKEAGLYWASRGALLNAASFATNEYLSTQQLNHMQAICYEKLKWLELRLGRIGPSLDWHTADRVVREQLAKNQEEREEVFKDTYYHYAMCLACLVIKTRSEDLQYLEKLPDSLIKDDLDFAAYGLMYLLGGPKYLPREFLESTQVNDLDDFFKSWLAQPAQDGLAETPDYYLADKVQLVSGILGATIEITCGNRSPAIELAESILASLEGFLSTAITLRATARVSKFYITLIPDNGVTELTSFSQDADRYNGIVIKYADFNPHKIEREKQEKIGNLVQEVIGYLLVNFIIFPKGVEVVIELFEKQKSFNRALNFLSSLVTTGNVLGYSPKRSATDWIEAGNTSYQLDPENGKDLSSLEVKGAGSQKGDNSGEDQLSDRLEELRKEDVPHNEMKVVNVLNDALWDKAKWCGAAYWVDQASYSIKPPVLVLMFEDKESASKIFREWIQEYGDQAGEYLHVSILKGINEQHPFWYRMNISGNPDRRGDSPTNYFVLRSRLHTMTPENNNNLDNFIYSFERFGFCFLAPGTGNSKLMQCEPMLDHSIRFKNIKFRHAWEVGLHDFDVVALSKEQRPVIPDSVVNPPVMEVLRDARFNLSDDTP